MQITSTAFTPADLDYFSKNFKVINANVNSLDEAEVILIGERHSQQEHIIKRHWLLNKLVREKDQLLVEGCQIKLTKNVYGFNFPYWPAAKIEVDGWDCAEGRAIHNHYVLKTLPIIKRLTELVSSEIPDTDETLRKAISQIVDFFEPGYIKKMSADFEVLKISSDKTKELLVYEQSLKNALNLVKNTSDFGLKRIFFKAVEDLIKIIDGAYEIKCACSFYKRNVSLANHVFKINKFYQRKFVFAGRAHLAMRKCSSSGDSKSVEYLNEALKSKKYIILFPNKNNHDLEIAKKFLEPHRITVLDKNLCELFNDKIGLSSLAFLALSLSTIALSALSLSNSDIRFLAATSALAFIRINRGDDTPSYGWKTIIREWIEPLYQLKQHLILQRKAMKNKEMEAILDELALAPLGVKAPA